MTTIHTLPVPKLESTKAAADFGRSVAAARLDLIREVLSRPGDPVDQLIEIAKIIQWS